MMESSMLQPIHNATAARAGPTLTFSADEASALLKPPMC